MHERGESDSPVVPAKPPNNAAQAGAEAVEGRGLAKGNAASETRPGRRAGLSVSSELERVRRVANEDGEARFTALLHHVSVDRLRAAYWALEPKAAPGVDGVTWRDYGQDLEANLRDLHGRVHRGSYRPRPSRRAYIAKADGRLRPLGIAALEDKILQRALVEVLNAIYEADFLGFSYGFRPGRSPHDALDALAVGIKRRKVNWVLDVDIRDFFTGLDQSWLERFLEHRIADRRVLRLIRKWLKAGVIEEGVWSESVEGTPQGASVTAPTQLATWRSVAARRGDRVTDGDIVLLAADEDFAHDEAQDALLLVHGQLVEAVGEAGEEAFERLGELEVGLGVVQFGFEGAELRGERGLALAQLGHPLAQLLERDQLLLVGLDQARGAGAHARELAFESLAAAGGGVLAADGFESALDLGSHELGLFEQVPDLCPDEVVELVCADRARLTDAAADVAVVVGADAAVVVDPAAAGARRGAVAGIAALAADEDPLQQRRLLGVARGEAFVLLQPRLRELEGLLADERRHRHERPVLGRLVASCLSPAVALAAGARRARRLGTLAAGLCLAEVAVAEGCANEHRLRALTRAVELPAPGALPDLRPLVFSDHPLELAQQLVLGRAGALAFAEKDDLDAGAVELLQEQHLVGVAAREAVGAVAEQDLKAALGGAVAQALERRPQQHRAGEALVQEHQLLGNDQAASLRELMQPGDLALDRAPFALTLRGHPRVDRRHSQRLPFDLRHRSHARLLAHRGSHGAARAPRPRMPAPAGRRRACRRRTRSQRALPPCRS